MRLRGSTTYTIASLSPSRRAAIKRTRIGTHFVAYQAALTGLGFRPPPLRVCLIRMQFLVVLRCFDPHNLAREQYRQFWRNGWFWHTSMLHTCIALVLTRGNIGLEKGALADFVLRRGSWSIIAKVYVCMNEIVIRIIKRKRTVPLPM
jgi:hypothetical protein